MRGFVLLFWEAFRRGRDVKGRGFVVNSSEAGCSWNEGSANAIKVVILLVGAVFGKACRTAQPSCLHHEPHTISPRP